MDKKLFVTPEQLREIEKTYLTSFYTCDGRGIRENAVRFKQALSWNKGHKEHFAVRATSNPFLLNILKDTGCGMGRSSTTEFMMSRVCGFLGSDITFSPNDTPPEEFVHAKKLRAIINLNDITHIQCLEEILGHISKTISYCFSSDGLFKVSNDIMDSPGDSKCGMTIEQIGQAFKTLKEKGVKYFGIHAFLASNTVANEYYPMLAKTLFGLTVKLKEGTGVHITLINLSGGIGIPYRPDQELNDILITSDGVRGIYEEILAPANMEDVALYIELGCFMMGPYGVLVTKTIHEKRIYKEHVGADAYAVNLIRSVMYSAHHHIAVMGWEDKPRTRMYGVVGPLCENSDKPAIDRMPPKTGEGDFLFIHDVGVHGFVMGYDYNSKLRSAEFLLKEDGMMGMTRRIEIPEDYFATFDSRSVLKGIG